MRYSRGNCRHASRPRVRHALLVAALVGVPACGGDRAARRGAAVFYASGADLQSINPVIAVHPLAKAVQKHVLLMTLATYDRALRPVPRLATWEWNAARDALTFSLRRDVFWHDGVPTTARDVVMTLDLARHPGTAYPRARDLAAVGDVAAVDSFTVRVQFERTQPVFPDVFTDLAMLPAHRFGGVPPEGIRAAAFNAHPIGNGPFEFVEHRPNQRWVFVRSGAFPAELGRPSVERFVVVVVDEAATKLAALTSQELDFAGISPAHAEFVRADPRLRVVDYPLQFVYALVWNLRRPLFRDARVRRALTAAIDRQLIVEAYLYGFGTVADGPVAPDHPWHVSSLDRPIARAEAARMLDEARLPPNRDGSRMSFELLTVEGDAALEQMIQAQLGLVGVDVRIRQLELASFLARAQSPVRDYDALVIGIPGDLALGYVAAMFESSEPGPLAYPGYQSERFDRAVRRARDAESEAALRNAWRDAQRVLAEDHPTTWIYHARGLQGANARVEGATIDLRGELANIAEWRFRGNEAGR